MTMHPSDLYPLSDEEQNALRSAIMAIDELIANKGDDQDSIEIDNFLIANTLCHGQKILAAIKSNYSENWLVSEYTDIHGQLHVTFSHRAYFKSTAIESHVPFAINGQIQINPKILAAGQISAYPRTPLTLTRSGPGGDGSTGPPGPPGLTGAMGATGPRGDTGLPGAPGQTGPQGNQGATGLVAVGITGLQGIQGNTGAQGNQGNTGPQGSQGNTGIVGAQGNTGTQGEQGETGLQGLRGNTGIQGIRGHTGLQGAQGDTGSQGLPGNTGLQGSVGATGLPGAQGDTGIRGALGDTGLQGSQGSTGVPGIPGQTGPKGDQGNTGLQGIRGDTGLFGQTGGTGAQGLQGDTGLQGPTGLDGIAGSTGAQGLTGVAGIAGSTGAQGLTGLDGIAGSTGAQGLTGVAGIAGSTGPAGIGQIGSQILSGTQGSILFVGSGSQLSQDNSNLFWNSADIRLGIGNSDPSEKLTVAGRISLAEGTAPSGTASFGKLWANSAADARPYWSDDTGQSFNLTLDRFNTLSPGATVTIDFSPSLPIFNTVDLNQNTTFAVSNIGNGRSASLRINCDGIQRTLTWPAGWTWLGPGAPTVLAANDTGYVSLLAFGSTDADVVASWSNENSPVPLSGDGQDDRVVVWSGAFTQDSSANLTFDGSTLTVSNGTSTNNILVVKDNASSVFTIADGGAATLTGGLTQSSGVFSLTGNSSSSLITSSGNISINPADTLNLGTATTTGISIGRSGITTTVTGSAQIVGGSLANNQRSLSVTGTLGTATNDNSAVDINITGSAPSVPTNSQYGLRTQFAGYTGAGNNQAGRFLNFSQGTGTDPISSSLAANYGLVGGTIATTTGTNIGVGGQAESGNLNVGVAGLSFFTKASAVNIGVGGVARNIGASATNIGGFFMLSAATPSASVYTSAALIASNGSTTSPIFVGRDNDTTIFTVADGGNTTINPLAGTSVNLNIQSLNTQAASGILRIEFPSAVAQAGTIVGQAVDLSTNLTTLVNSNVFGYRLSLPSISDAVSGTMNYRGFDLFSSGTLTNNGSGSVDWRGISIQNPNITNSGSGTVAAAGAIIGLGGITVDGTQYGLRVSGAPSAGIAEAISVAPVSSTSAVQYAVHVNTGWDRALLAEMGPVSGQNISAIEITTDALTTTSGISTINGLLLSSAGALSGSTAGSITWNGSSIAMPNITQGTGGSVSATGLKVTTGSVITNGVMKGIDVIPSAISAGQVVGVDVGEISAGAGSRIGLRVGGNWNYGILSGSPVQIVSGAATASNITTLECLLPTLAAQPAGQEIRDISFFGGTQGIEYSAGDISYQRMIDIYSRLYTFTGTSQVDVAASIYINNPPRMGNNANALISAGIAIGGQDITQGSGTVESGYGLLVAQPIGATYNWAAGFVGDVYISSELSVGSTSPARSKLYVNGSFGAKIDEITSASSPYSPTINNSAIITDASSGNVSIDLPEASLCLHRQYTLTRADSSANSVTIEGYGTQAVGDYGSYKLTEKGQSVTIASTGSDWVVLSASSDAATYNQKAVKTASQDVTGATLTNDDHLFAVLRANRSYAFKFYLQPNSNNNPTSNLVAKLSLTSSPARIHFYGANIDNISLGYVVAGMSTSTGTSITFPTSSSGTDLAIIEGSITTGSTDATLRLQWASSDTDGTITLFNGSYLLVDVVS